MKIEKKKLLTVLPFVLLWLCALGFATVYDLDISLAVADRNSVFGRIFEIAGEPPAILFASFNFSVLMAYRLRCTELRLKDKLTAVLFFILSVGTAVYTFVRTCNYCIDWLDDRGIGFRLDLVFYLLMLLAALITVTVFILSAMTMDEKRLHRIYSVAKSCAFAAAATFAIIWAFKLTWGRIRFRQMGGDLTLFTPWYLPRGFTGGFSFPSGHTANATVIFSVIHYFRFLPERLHRLKPLILTALGIWIVVVASSRVFAGAHYLSDVLFGMAITLAIVYFSRPRNKQ